MHILFLTNEYPKKGLNGGGIGSFVQFLGRKLTEHGIQVSVVGINNIAKNEVEQDQGVSIYRLTQSTWKIAKFYDNTKRIISKIKEIDALHKIDIVEGSELNFAFFPKNTSYKKVIRLHGGHHFFAIELNKKPAFWRGYQEKKSFANADSYVAVSNYVGHKTQQYLNHNFPYTTIYNSVDADKFKPKPHISVEENSLLFVGTICEKKGIRQLVQAMPLIKKEIPNVKLKIVGRDWKLSDGSSYTEYLKTYITEELKSSIEFIGAVAYEEVSNYIAAAEICVYPSQMESFGLTLIEALLMEKPVVCSNIKPFQEIKGATAVLTMTDVNSIPTLAKAIINCLLQKEESKVMGKQARTSILNRFESNQIVNQNIDFYRKQIN